jgi:hypothetical protein
MLWAAAQIPSLRDATRTGRLRQRQGGFLPVVGDKTVPTLRGFYCVNPSTIWEEMGDGSGCMNLHRLVLDFPASPSLELLCLNQCRNPLDNKWFTSRFSSGSDCLEVFASR